MKFKIKAEEYDLYEYSKDIKSREYYLGRQDWSTDADMILFLDANYGWIWQPFDELTFEWSMEEIKEHTLVDYSQAEELQEKFGGEIYKYDGSGFFGGDDY